jgi:hypothetical protein
MSVRACWFTGVGSVLLLAACSAAPLGERTGEDNEPLVACGAYQTRECSDTGPTGKPICSCEDACAQSMPQCSARQISWLQATPAGNLPETSAWITSLENAGCETPQGLAFIDADGLKSGLVVTVCPVSVTQQPLPYIFPQLSLAQTTWPNVELGCNACIPPAPAGWVNLAWDPENDSPSGCKAATCGGLPPPS